MLLKTDYLLLPDSNIYNDEVKLNLVKQYRQKLRDFLNQLMNEKIDTNMFLDIDDYVDAYFPKLNVQFCSPWKMLSYSGIFVAIG